eukprot:2816664-Alexandrium_andersonii.AAC.1
MPAIAQVPLEQGVGALRPGWLGGPDRFSAGPQGLIHLGGGRHPPAVLGAHASDGLGLLEPFAA